ncbi:hypothetical protein PIIN_01890 [Serendipita indica DSM 11827]|uniref:N-acetyltransferase domain-containing protein n=1 Tax=Serendipita indica (strain DSM 11827) TaxID=1109443 RepID=G4T9Q1_SERID|nr:hypothetical protein PIIN_01890 [Serendipita indica DSM 11827]
MTSLVLRVHHSPLAFLDATRGHVEHQQRKLNVILPLALKLAKLPASHIKPGQFWLTAWSTSSSSRPALEFILSCTEHHMGTYPLFLVYLRPYAASKLPTATLSAHMHLLAQHLTNLLPPTRVFSIFGQKRPTELLCAHWERLVSMKRVQEPYYSASSSYCTRQTLSNRGRSPLPAGHQMRLATMHDAQAVARLCAEFAEDSPPFTLTPARALQEATYMITHQLVSVYTINGIITTLVAVTRLSSSVAGMTKVYTTPAFRGRGCAEALVHHVTTQMLHERNMDSVVLFVGHTLAAKRVYDRVGFAGLGSEESMRKREEGEPVIDDVEDWIEIGFEGAEVGHW